MFKKSYNILVNKLHPPDQNCIEFVSFIKEKSIFEHALVGTHLLLNKLS